MKRENVNYGKKLKQWSDKALNAGKEIEAMKGLMLHRFIPLSLHRFCCPALLATHFFAFVFYFILFFQQVIISSWYVLWSRQRSCLKQRTVMFCIVLYTKYNIILYTYMARHLFLPVPRIFRLPAHLICQTGVTAILLLSIEQTEYYWYPYSGSKEKNCKIPCGHIYYLSTYLVTMSTAIFCWR
jgi:hypothetical protein